MIKPAIFILMLTLTHPLARTETLDQSDPSENNSTGGTLRLSGYVNPAPFDPFNVTESITGPLMELIFNHLVRFNNNGQLVGDLAKYWDISKDGLIYTFHLREGVLFHNGKECTSEDVRKTFLLYSNPQISPSYYKLFQIVDHWDAPSKYVFRVFLKERYSSFVYSLWYGYIVPEQIFENAEKNVQAFIESPIGTGPYAFVEKSSDKIILRANKDYFEGKSHVDSINVHLYPEKRMVWASFLRGEADLDFYLNAEDYREIRNNQSFKFFKSTAPGGSMLIFNFKDSLMAEFNIREAISLSLDRNEILNKVQNGEGVLIDGPFPLGLVQNDSSVSIREFNPDRGLELLKMSGFEKSEGFMERHGKKLILRLLVDGKNNDLVKMAKLIRQQLQEVGIGVELVYFNDYSEHQAFLNSKDPKFQAFLFFFNSGIDPDAVSVYWETSGKFNYGNYQNSSVDQLFYRARKSSAKSEADKFYQQIHSVIIKDKPAIFFYSPYVFHAASKKISGLEKLSGTYLPFCRIREIQKK